MNLKASMTRETQRLRNQKRKKEKKSQIHDVQRLHKKLKNTMSHWFSPNCSSWITPQQSRTPTHIGNSPAGSSSLGGEYHPRQAVSCRHHRHSTRARLLSDCSCLLWTGAWRKSDICSALRSMKDSDAHMTRVHLTGLSRDRKPIVMPTHPRYAKRI